MGTSHRRATVYLQSAIFSFALEYKHEAESDMKTIVINLVTLCLISVSLRCVADELNCLSAAEKKESDFYALLQQQAYKALDDRLARYEELKTPAEISDYQEELRSFFVKQLGGFPERTPLNAQTIRTIDEDGYKIECVIFESQPNHHITANLYLPNVATKVPGVVVSSGHSRTAKTADYNQRFGIMMAKQGMAALCFDPIGQGERSQILNEKGQPQFNGTTTEHSLVGVGSILVGRSTARYRIWDAMRAIDYLASRSEVLPDKIGFTGCSGGGTLTSYVMALDDRVACAAPACYLTTFRHLIQTVGPQDAEQNIFGQIARGLDHPDYVLMRAPRPTLTSCTTGDYFSVAGAWDNYRQAKRIYGKLGFPERVDLVEVDGNHGVRPQNLATIAHWMKRWLLNKDEPVTAVELETRPPESLHCTPSGQVLTHFPDEKSVVHLNTDYERELAAARKTRWNTQPHDELRQQVRELIAIAPFEKQEPPVFTDKGRVTLENYHIDKLTLKANGRTLPGLTYHPPVPVDDAYLYLHDDGKRGDSSGGGPIEKLIDEGFAVVSIDMSGQGETGTGANDPVLTDWKTYFLSYLLGKPLLGTRVEDALAAADFVAYYQKKRTNPRKVHLVGVGRAGLVALHAAALQPDRFETVTVRDTPTDWASVVQQKTPVGQLDATVHGALRVYDIPDLLTLIGDGKVSIEE